MTLAATQLTVKYNSGRQQFAAVDEVDLSVPEGATVGLVGESGSGKSTFARAVVGLTRVANGTIVFDGRDITNPRGAAARHVRKEIQMIFQDPYSSLNPRMSAYGILSEALEIHQRLRRAGRRSEVARLMEIVRLDPKRAHEFPHQFSGGERQRLAFARALAARPRLLLLDEVTSSLDVLVQAQVLALLQQLQKDLGLSYLLISHNLAVVSRLAETVAVMYLGNIVEQGPTSQIFDRPQHPYSRVLVDSALRLSAGAEHAFRAIGEMSDPHSPPTGCRFHTRCPIGPASHPERTRCKVEEPVLAGSPTHVCACHYAGSAEMNGAGV